MAGPGRGPRQSAGGDRRSGRIEAQAGFLLGQVERRPDVTLAELQALPFERGVAVGRCEHAFQIVGKARGTVLRNN